MRDTKTFIVFEVTLTTATKNLLLCIFLAQIKEHFYYQLRVLISVYVHFLFFISNCGLGLIVIGICFIFTPVIIFKKITPVMIQKALHFSKLLWEKFALFYIFVVVLFFILKCKMSKSRRICERKKLNHYISCTFF